MLKGFVLTLLLALSLLAPQSQAAAGLPLEISLNGHSYQLDMQPNDHLLGKLRGANAQSQANRHFRGRLAGVPGSWVRLSRLDGRWTGLAGVAGDIHVLSQGGEAGVDASPEAQHSHLSLTGLHDLPERQCASVKAVPGAEKVFFDSQPVASHSVFQAPAKAKADFGELCANTVDGVCMLAEIEFVFDQQFQNQLSDPQATAAAIINLIEGYYEESFDIVFDVITTEFLSSQVFTASTDVDVLLGGTDPAHPVEDPQSIRAMSVNGELPFEQSRPALLHVITGRSFDGGTAGIAFTDVLCNNSGYASGTSQLLGVGSGDEAALTALVAAHEIGHNFGAGHDGDAPNNCGNGFLMQASLSSSTGGFSSCSFDEIEAAIDRINSLAQCFNFPADASISADAENPTQGTQHQEFTADFALALEQGFMAVSALEVQGSISTGEGRFAEVSLNGAACTVAANGQSYNCNLSNPMNSASLQVNAVATTEQASFTHSVAVGSSPDIVETDSSNNEIVHSLSFEAGPAPEPEPEPEPDPPQPEPTQPSPEPVTAPAADSGGGGGSLGLWPLMLLLLAALRRQAKYLVLLLPGLSACQNPAASESSVADAAGASSYSYVQQRQCYCRPEFTRPITVWVSKGEVSQARYADDGSMVPDEVRRSLRSEEAWKREVAKWQQHQPHRLGLQYFEESGRLKLIDMDPSAMKSDDEFTLRFSEFRAAALSL